MKRTHKQSVGLIAALAAPPLLPLAAQAPPASPSSPTSVAIAPKVVAPVLIGAMDSSVALRDSSVLILTLDDLARPVSSSAPATKVVVPQSAPKTPLLSPVPLQPPLPAPIAPLTPQTDKEKPRDDRISPFVPERPPLPAPITPAQGVFKPQIVLRALAKKADKSKDKDDERFKPLPLPPQSYPPKAETGGASPLDASPLGPSSSAGPMNTAPTAPLSAPSIRVPSLAATGSGVQLPGPAMMVAAPLRRSLIGLGLREDKVLSTPLDSPAVVRALNSGILPQRVLQELQTAMSQIVYGVAAHNDAKEDVDSWRQDATRAASRIGQTLGYRAVVVLFVEPARTPLLLTAADGSAPPQAINCTMLLADSMRDSGQIIRYRADAMGATAMNDAAARIGAGELTKELSAWPPVSASDRSLLVSSYYKQAEDAVKRDDLDAARDYAGRVTALDPTRTDASMLLAGALEKSSPAEAAALYLKVASMNESDGAAWARAAIALTKGDSPDWVGALQAANKALKLKAETSELRLAMANAEYGRAVLYRRADRVTRAEDIELDARRHLDRAMDLAGDDARLTREATWVLAHHLIETKRYRDAVQTLDKSAVQYPDDVEIQTLYATALSERGDRDEDAFVVWSRVWKLSGEQEVPLDPTRYAHLANGFDMRVANLAKNAGQLANGVATGAVERVQALLLLRRLRQEMDVAASAIKTIVPPPGNIGSTAHWQRIFAVDLIVQALENYQMFIETGQDVYRVRAAGLHQQSLAQINTARSTR